MKRKTIGETPWDAVVPPKETSGPTPKKTRKSAAPVPSYLGKLVFQPVPHAPGRATKTTSLDPVVPKKERLTVHLTVAVAERAKNAVYWTPGLTLAGLTENALQKALEGLEKAHGGPFDHRKEELKGGRPMK